LIRDQKLNQNKMGRHKVSRVVCIFEEFLVEKRYHAKSQKEWRDWLRKNHKRESKVYLVKYKKHTGKPTVTTKDALYEAICFGWIDTTVKRLDDEKYQQCFVKRNKNSRWSINTLRYAREMIKAKKMTKEGMKWYKEGLKKKTIDHGLPKNPTTPSDLKKALGKNLSKFEKLAPSTRRYSIYFIEKAKRQETRKKRINEVLRLIR